jgi:hypothetical protein
MIRLTEPAGRRQYLVHGLIVIGGICRGGGPHTLEVRKKTHRRASVVMAKVTRNHEIITPRRNMYESQCAESSCKKV